MFRTRQVSGPLSLDDRVMENMEFHSKNKEPSLRNGFGTHLLQSIPMWMHISLKIRKNRLA